MINLMDDFETFKAAREKMDPSSRDMTDHQWRQAFDAYQRARERVGGESGEASRRRRRRRPSENQSTQETVRGQHRPSSLSEAGNLRSAIRAESAYQDLRLLIDLLSWLAIIVVVLGTVVSLFYYTSLAAVLIDVLDAAVQVIAILAFRFVIQVVVDIPDIALYRTLHPMDSSERPMADLDAPRGKRP